MTGTAIDSAVSLGTAGVLALAAVVLFRRHPLLAVIAWFSVCAFVPYWYGIDVGPAYLAPTTLVGVVVAAAGVRRLRLRFALADGAVVVLLVAYALAAVFADVRLDDGLRLVATWTLGYVVGRLVVAHVSARTVATVIAVVFGVVAVLALAEALTGHNLFVGLARDSSQYAVWGTLQTRGGMLRAEGAFGQSIALGASLALAVPFIVASRLPAVLRLAILALVLAAVVVTFSRSAMLDAALGLVLTAVFLRHEVTRRFRIVLVALLVVGSAAVAPFVTSVFADAGTEAGNSAAYRGELLGLVPRMQLLGLSPSFSVSPDGTATFGQFHSIDSALVLAGLAYGLIPLAVVVLLLVGAIVLVVSGRAAPATIAVVAAIPAIATVALITQFAMLLWVVVGVAVTSQAALRPAIGEDGLVDGPSDPVHRSPSLAPPAVMPAPVPTPSRNTA